MKECKVCKVCKADNPDEALFCHECGKKFDNKYAFHGDRKSASVEEGRLFLIEDAVKKEGRKLVALRLGLYRHKDLLYDKDFNNILEQIEDAISKLSLCRLSAIRKLEASGSITDALEICQKESNRLQKEIKIAKNKKAKTKPKEIKVSKEGGGHTTEDVNGTESIKSFFKVLFIVAAIAGVVWLFVEFWTQIKLIFFIILIIAVVSYIKS